MTPTEQKHAIALACGLKHEPPPKDLNLEWGATPPPGVFWLDHQIPAYTTDLNAMHEVEKLGQSSAPVTPPPSNAPKRSCA